MLVLYRPPSLPLNAIACAPPSSLKVGFPLRSGDALGLGNLGGPKQNMAGVLGEAPVVVRGPRKIHLSGIIIIDDTQMCTRGNTPLSRSPYCSHFYHSSTTVTMPQTPAKGPVRANHQSIFDSALQEYEKKTRKDLSSNPLFHKLQSCDSPDDIITTLRQQIPEFDQSAGG